MKTSPTITKIAPAVVAFCADVKAVAKNATNSHFGSRYATLDALWTYVRPHLAQHGLAYIEGGEPTDGTHITLTGLLLHVSGEWISGALTLPLDKATAQGVGSAVTYGRRYLLGMMLSLTTDDDDDGNAASATSATSAPRAASAPRPPRSASGPTLPFGKTKGMPLSKMQTDDLESALEWARDKGKFQEFQRDAEAELSTRSDRE